MIRKILALFALSVSLVACQFTETMTLNEDGTGRMSISMDLSEMMAFGGEMSQDSSFQKMDSIVSFKEIFAEKKDSIAKLPQAEQDRLKKRENYMIRMKSDPDANEMIVEIFTDFKNVNEANDLMQGFEQSDGMIPGANVSSSEEGQEKEEQIVGVDYSFAKGVFKRDAYIKDKVRHQQQLDSMKQAESFMSSMRYKVKYTFPRKIKRTSIDDATFSLDGKTMELERSFLEYMKNPDVLDVEVELEN